MDIFGSEKRENNKNRSRVSRDLAVRIITGDGLAINEFVKLNYAWLLFVVQHKFSRSNNHEDIVQDSFMLVINKLKHGAVNNPNTILAYLRSTAINIGFEYLRKDKKFKSAINHEMQDVIEECKQDILTDMVRQDKIDYIKKVMDDFDDSRFAFLTVFYATDRNIIRKDNKVKYGNERANITRGYALVSIPEDHKMGNIESPSLWKLQFRKNPEKHVILHKTKVTSINDFYDTIESNVNKSNNKNSLIFIHGYNVSFDDAAKRTAQIAYDLEFDGVPIFYSWPSQGSIPKYTFDEANIEWSEPNIENFLKEFAINSGSDNIYIIAHSMGNRALSRIYISLLNNNPNLRNRFKEVILAAPDIDAEVFNRDIAPRMIEKGNPVTLYASSNDLALKASKKVHGGYLRAGDSGKEILVLDGMESIDCSDVETGFLGHSYYAEEQSIISDMYYIFNGSIRAKNRSCLRERKNNEGKLYWKFKK